MESMFRSVLPGGSDMTLRVPFNAMTVLLVGLLNLAPPAAAAQEERTQWDGVFTEAQAHRGEILFEERCHICHGGDIAPDVRGPRFNTVWDGASLGELFEYIKLTMPQDLPGSLTDQEYADVIAHMFGGAGVPAGSEELPGDVEALNQITFVATRPETTPTDSTVAPGPGDTPPMTVTEDEFQRLFTRMIGTWEFQPDKSTYVRSKAPQSWTVTYERTSGKTVTHTSEMVGADGSESSGASVHVLDGSDYARPSSEESIATLPVDEYTISTTLKDAGRVTSRDTQLFSIDGRRMTVIARDVNEQGDERFASVRVFDKIDE
jgi:hypothetical protein